MKKSQVLNILAIYFDELGINEKRMAKDVLSILEILGMTPPNGSWEKEDNKK